MTSPGSEQQQSSPDGHLISPRNSQRALPSFSFSRILSEYPNLCLGSDESEDENEPFTDDVREEKDQPMFSFSRLASEHPHLCSVHDESEEGGSESSDDSLTRTLLQIHQQSESPVYRRSSVKKPSPLKPSIDITRGGGSTSSDDSLTRALLQIHHSPVCKRPLEEIPSPQWPSVERGGGSTSSDDSLLKALLQINYSPVCRRSLEEIPSPQRPSVERENSTGGSQTSSVYPSKHFLEKASTLYKLRRVTPPQMRKSPIQRSPFSTAIDPYAVGLVVVQETLQEHTRLMDELKRDRETQSWRARQEPCPCDVARHPRPWTMDIITAVHSYSFLLDCQGLEMLRSRVVGANSTETVVIYNVPMLERHHWKMKAENVLRFVDIELGVGDQMAYDLFHYVQPCNRQIMVVVSSRRVVGLIIAEKMEWANRILMETERYRDLEEDPVPVRVGVNRLWIHVSMRRQHLATCLCHLVRKMFYEDEELQLKDFAFNDISDAGVAFAKMFLKTNAVPLYSGKTGMRH
ncbi:uncharacterized protein LOC124365745 isoform X1 [Homalodisca vitripennis]|uniref:uncharacterized protein LOC124365745 isoform X1 n=1 Tax=Homalodisca vitripennis TaxID=197043 RepID=UPI001EEBD69C|nr:uncharacterized protein LOC124365745 isoform X1 [Homalodisca vitripennis]XP_046677691.1 uncharacterized protein LOC124365745 isoform X1 [Homalodisca vitripennis]